VLATLVWAGWLRGDLQRSLHSLYSRLVVDALHAHTLHPRALTRNHAHRARWHIEDIGQQCDRRLVGAVIDGWCRDTHLERVAVTADDRGSTGTRLDVHSDNDGIAVGRHEIGRDWHVTPSDNIK
jgi:hypothetical protein